MREELIKDLIQLEALGRKRSFAPAVRYDEAALKIRDKRVVNFTSWDYLGVSQTGSVKVAAQREIERLGLGVSASRLSSGSRAVHSAAEKRLASFLGVPGSLLFSTRNQVVLSLITALGSELDIFIAEDLVQSPVVDAACLINAPFSTFRIEDLHQLDQKLISAKSSRRKFIFIESISPISGETAPLKEIVAIATRHGAALCVDESYALGAVGLRGAGVCERLGILGEIFCILGSLGYGVGCYGGFVAGDSVLIEYLQSTSRTFVSEPAPLPALAAAIEEALNVIELRAERREELAKNTAVLRDGLKELGLKVSESLDSPVLSFAFPTLRAAEELGEALFQQGYLIDVLQAGIPLSEAGVGRIIANAAHSESQLSGVLRAISGIVPRLPIG